MATFHRTTTEVAAALDQTYILRKVIKALRNKLRFGDFITPGTVPMHQGSTIRWVLANNIDDIETTTNTNVLDALDDDGTMQDGSNPFRYSNRETFHEAEYLPGEVEAPMRTYGAFLPWRNCDMDNLVAGTADQISSAIGYLSNKTLDTRLRVTVDGTQSAAITPNPGAGTTQDQPAAAGWDAIVGGTPTGATSKLNGARIAAAVKKLTVADAEPFDNGMYPLLIHAAAENDLITNTVNDLGTADNLAWTEINKYVSGMTGQAKIGKGVIGGIASAMAFRTNNIGTATIGTTDDTYVNMLLAKDSIGAANMKDMNPRILINRAGSQSMSDPYREFTTIAFKFRGAFQMLRATTSVKVYSK